MNKNLTFIYTAIVVLCCIGCTNTQKPNVVLIIADDLGYADIGCYGSSFYETPNIDNLAAEAVKFTQGYASCPVCSPSRASVQTGKHPVAVEITDWIPGRAYYRGSSERERLLAAEMQNQLALEETTIAEILQNNNYKTFFAGKWHLGETDEFWPEHQGYQINKGGWKKGAPFRKKDSICNGYFAPYCNPRLTDGPVDEYLPERLTDEVDKFIEENKENPFFVCLPFYLVHTPIQAKQELIAKYKAKATKLGLDTINPFLPEQPWMINNAKPSNQYKERNIQSNAVYAAMVEAMDQNIGRVITKLKEEGLYDNSIIIFTSDNGGLSTAEGTPTSNLPLRAGKGWLYEGGIRVPFVIKYPNSRFGAKVSDVQVSGIDIMPTILSAINIENPVNNISGIDITPFLNDEDIPDRALYWHYPHYSNQGGNPGSVIIEGDFKLIDDFETGKKELYNLTEDISEQNDIANDNPDMVKSLYEKLDEWRKRNGAKMMKENPDWNGKG